MSTVSGFFSEGTKDEEQDPSFIVVDPVGFWGNLRSGVSTCAFRCAVDDSLYCQVFRCPFTRTVSLVLQP